MIEPYLLEELVTFATTKTLAQTASKLHVTQPAITRGMQKLETELGVQLFDRQPNRLRLTPTGKLAAQAAQTVLAANRQFVTQVQNFERSQRQLPVGLVIPGPRQLLAQLADTELPTINLSADLLEPTAIRTALTTDQMALVISNQKIQDDRVTSVFLGIEALAVHLNQFMYHANQAKVQFTDLAGLSFLVLTDIGPWRAIIKHNIPTAKFFYQTQREALAEITKYSDFPYFSTNFTTLEDAATSTRSVDSRVRLPITDTAAHMQVYGNFLTTQRSRVAPVITALKQHWPTV